ncbi:lipid-A-disaccharide synthase [Pseudohongiella spirulinae]|uniref:Lipid-A-disaccharide synthase n=1 Tax=Pseudohongiella spirulinae TaxID=1249552 RepID=A0A0S2KDK8_9GAMM|nr:lipid-A-disaccharide synthase [Pseudohongiella spirulinae]ALO46050.1 Lipid-A-disaccharide synthase [Pseudohongiella spirulinae]
MLIGMVAGETSGDMLGAGLMQALLQRYPQARFVGVGGPRMIALGFQSLVPMERLSVMGFVEPLGRLPELLRLKRDLVCLYRQEKPAVFIGIDSPGFNLRLERELHAADIKTAHYVSPSVWAWGKGRIRSIKQSVDLMLTLFPFELDIYQQHKIPAVCVGHHLADRIQPLADHGQLVRRNREELGLDHEGQYICLMPGSRRAEVQRLAPVFLEAAGLLLSKRQELRFLAPCSDSARREQFEQLLAAAVLEYPALAGRITLLDGQSHQAMAASELVLLASGTATLEAMLLGCPMVVCYKLAPMTWHLASRMLTVSWISLPNLLAAESLVPEILQNDVTAGRLSEEMEYWLDNPEQVTGLREKFIGIHQSIRLGADKQAADSIVNLINEQLQTL